MSHHAIAWPRASLAPRIYGARAVAVS
jgi:hypothetical protein